ncbi:hypothetical protein EDB89DRAFT_584188 [Lactarius sanguifluus]|nr:hypothetical protein EDB89DRAFT_584188 [Lactarius sanguifluus]
MNDVMGMLLRTTLMRIPRANKTDVETPPRASFGIAQADARLLVSCLIKVIRPKGTSKPPFKFRTAWLAMRIPSASASTFATAPTSSPAVPARSSSSRGGCVSYPPKTRPSDDTLDDDIAPAGRKAAAGLTRPTAVFRRGWFGGFTTHRLQVLSILSEDRSTCENGRPSVRVSMGTIT